MRLVKWYLARCCSIKWLIYWLKNDHRGLLPLVNVKEGSQLPNWSELNNSTWLRDRHRRVHWLRASASQLDWMSETKTNSTNSDGSDHSRRTELDCSSFIQFSSSRRITAMVIFMGRCLGGGKCSGGGANVLHFPPPCPLLLPPVQLTTARFLPFASN